LAKTDLVNEVSRSEMAVRGRNRRQNRAKLLRTSARDAFSLVEVSMAIGIMSFSFLAIFGLIPVGLDTFRKAVDVTVGSQIAERIFSECKGMTFDNLTNSTRWNPASADALRFPTRYFNEAGEETKTPDTETIYQVNVRVLPSTPFLEALGAGTDPNADLATVTIQVAYDPGSQALAIDGSTGLWTGAYQSKASAIGAVPILTYSAFVGRNQ
jgi:uncharacterized protein (TIGR02598 family)